MPLLGTCQPSGKREVAPKPRQKQPLPVSTEDLLRDQYTIGRARKMGKTLEEITFNFMALVEKQPKGCWIWNGKINKSRGYGMTNFGRGKGFLAHRVSYVLFVGTIPVGQLVLHKCDVRRCVNPDHFFLGNDTDNAMDSAKKFRKQSKLTVESVIEARRLYWEEGLSQRKIAERLGVTQSNICCVLKGKTWFYV